MIQIEGQEVNKGNSHGDWFYLYQPPQGRSHPEGVRYEPTAKAIRSARGTHPGVPPFLLEATNRCCRARNPRLPSPSPTLGQDQEGYEERPRCQGAPLSFRTRPFGVNEYQKMIAADGTGLSRTIIARAHSSVFEAPILFCKACES